MKRLILFAGSCALLAACANKIERREARTSDEIEKLQAEASALCIRRAMYAPVPVPSDASEEARKEAAFTNYYEAFLYAKEGSEVVDCWRKRWRIPWLHSMYREDVRDLNKAKAILAESEPLAGQGKRILDVKEDFTRKDPEHSVRRVTILLSDGTQKTVENVFEK